MEPQARNPERDGTGFPLAASGGSGALIKPWFQASGFQLWDNTFLLFHNTKSVLIVITSTENEWGYVKHISIYNNKWSYLREVQISVLCEIQKYLLGSINCWLVPIFRAFYRLNLSLIHLLSQFHVICL